MGTNGPSGRQGKDDDVVVRKADHGWVVGGENVSDLTSAMVLADLFAADQAANDDTGVLEAVGNNGEPRQPAPRQPAPRQRAPRPHTPGRHAAGPADGKRPEADEAQRLAVTVSQLEHALASRVRVEQAIGVLAERHRIHPREAFDLLRGAARSRGRRVTEIAQDVVASAANPLLRLPEELARKLPEPRQRGRSLRRRHAEI
ncbi:MAG TPA: ANTAR domain-containing protein [Trebonia sp.]